MSIFQLFLPSKQQQEMSASGVHLPLMIPACQLNALHTSPESFQPTPADVMSPPSSPSCSCSWRWTRPSSAKTALLVWSQGPCSSPSAGMLRGCLSWGCGCIQGCFADGWVRRGRRSGWCCVQDCIWAEGMTSCFPSDITLWNIYLTLKLTDCTTRCSFSAPFMLFFWFTQILCNRFSSLKLDRTF